MKTGYFISLGLSEGALRYFVPLPIRNWHARLPPGEELRGDITFSPEVAESLAKGFLFAASAARLPRASGPLADGMPAHATMSRLHAVARMATNFLDAADALVGGLCAASLAESALKLRLLSPSLPRREAVWVGASHSIYQSSWVCPEPGVWRDLFDDLCWFFNYQVRGDVLALAAVHLQFTSMHPLRDGNGRMARALVFAMLLRRTGSRVLAAAVAYLLVRRGKRLAQCQRAARAGEPDALFRFWSGLLKDAQHVTRLSRAYILDLIGRGGFELYDILPALERSSCWMSASEAAVHPLLHRRRAGGMDGYFYESRPYADLFGAWGDGSGWRSKNIVPWFEHPASHALAEDLRTRSGTA